MTRFSRVRNLITRLWTIAVLGGAATGALAARRTSAEAIRAAVFWTGFSLALIVLAALVWSGEER